MDRLGLLTDKGGVKFQTRDIEAARQNVALARQTRLPAVGAGYQLGLATYNNVTGMFLPGSFLPISGPPSAENDAPPAPGSALSVLTAWQPWILVSPLVVTVSFAIGSKRNGTLVLWQILTNFGIKMEVKIPIFLAP